MEEWALNALFDYFRVDCVLSTGGEDWISEGLSEGLGSIFFFMMRNISAAISAYASRSAPTGSLSDVWLMKKACALSLKTATE